MSDTCAVKQTDHSCTYSLLSLFSGAGALDYGFELTGRFQTKVCIELEPIFCRTLVGNQRRGFLSGAEILNECITAITPVAVRREHFAGSAPDGIIGGPPCESFSVRGNRRGLADPRGRLIFSFLNWVDELCPRYFLMENVPPVVRFEGGKVLRDLRAKAEELGYRVSHAILNAAEYGAPTTRQRFFMVGVRGSRSFSFPEPSHTDLPIFIYRKAFLTVADALHGIPEPCWTEPGVPQGHVGVRHTPTVEARFAELRPGQQDNVRKRTRLDLSKPSPTLVAGNLMQIRSHIHPTEPRELTNRESARLHGFPDEFVFAGNHPAVGKQIANSVPIALAQALAHAIATHLDLL
jgi:DNA (cytosine-5)-methyltransferase 1